MKKILALLFVCVFSQTIFASRVLIIRNNSSSPQAFYALEMVVYEADYEINRCIYTVMMNPIILEPGKQIMFAQYTHGDNDSFGYCPTPSIPNNDYKVFPFESNKPITNFEWVKYKYQPPPLSEECILEGTFKCQDVSQYPYNGRVLFRGFKTCILSSVIGGHPATDDYVRVIPGVYHYLPDGIEFSSFETRAMFYELLTFND